MIDEVGGGDHVDTTTERERFGARLRSVRQGQGLTLNQVAARAGVTASALSQIERGRSGATIETVVRIAGALNVSTGSLFIEDNWRTQPLRRADRVAMRGSGGHLQEVLNRRGGTRFEVFEVQIPPGVSDAPHLYAHGDSEEMLLILDGALELQLGGHTYQLEEGDTIEFQTSIPHLVTNRRKTEARALWIISPPTSGRHYESDASPKGHRRTKDSNASD